MCCAGVLGHQLSLPSISPAFSVSETFFTPNTTNQQSSSSCCDLGRLAIVKGPEKAEDRVPAATALNAEPLRRARYGLGPMSSLGPEVGAENLNFSPLTLRTYAEIGSRRQHGFMDL